MGLSIDESNQASEAMPVPFWKSPRGIVVIASAVLLGFVIFSYIRENRGGKTAWLKHKHELEARGENLDWQAYIPAPIPAAQNIFAAPGISDSFVKGGSARMTWQLSPTLSSTQRPLWRAMPVAEVTVVLTDQGLPAKETDLLLYYDAPNLKIAGNGDEPTSSPPVL